jgi:hypothetical protein
VSERQDPRVPRDADGVTGGRGVAARAARVAAKAARAAANVTGKSGPADTAPGATPFSVPSDRVRTVPEATVGRLAIYLRALSAFAEKGTTTVSSDALAVAAGVTSILNFAPVVLSVPDGVDVRKVDLAVELQILSFHEERKSAAPGDSDWGEVG